MKNNKTAKMGILVVVLLLAVAFAAVSTQLNMEGSATIGKNDNAFEKKVVFETEGEKAPYLLTKSGTKIAITGDDIEEDKTTLYFNVPELTIKGDYADLHYWVKNESTNYNAKLARVSCEVTANDEESADASYLVIVEGDKHDGVVLAEGETTKDDNTVRVSLNKTYTGDDKPGFTISCTIEATGESK